LTPDDVYDLFFRDYFVMAFVTALGAVQLGAALGGLRGMLILPWGRVTRWSGALLIFLGLAHFFLSPLWSEGPWASEFGRLPPGGIPERTAEWGRASVDDYARARIINDIDGGLSGTDQAAIFAAAAALAIALSMAAGGIRRAGGSGMITDADADPGAGLELLRSRRYFPAQRATLRHWRAVAPAEIRRQWANPAHRGGLRDMYDWWRRR
jgi:hypothetical protein